MLNPLRALGKALRDLFDDFLLLVVCNIIWSLMCLPIWMFALFLIGAGAWPLAITVALVGVLPAGPATAGLFYVAYRVVDGRASKVADFFAGLRQYARPGWAIIGVATASFLLIGYNLGFYLTVTNLFGAIMLGLWLYGLLFWLGLLLYAPALVFLQEQPDLRMVARNAFLMALGRPIFTFVSLVLAVALLVLSLYLVVPPFLITAALFALWSVHATRQLIEDARRRREGTESAA
ncbi:MAG: hypothetical protein HGA45_27290, partial [Chloroflexales bacterium]|nr:hypothetical protein [Chloroflexales bacterium]